MRTPTTDAGELWTLEDLTARVVLALSWDYAGAANGRIRDVPDARAIRYYTTLGLIDRPTFIHGRKGYYGKRHLRQLVAIKRLQAEGLPLARIQQLLAGISDRRLADLARVSAGAESAAPRATAPSTPDLRRREDAFWTRAASPRPPETASSTDAQTASGTPAAPQALRLGAGVLLVLENSRPLAAGDAEALSAAAKPLIQLLHERGLVSDPPDRRGES